MLFHGTVYIYIYIHTIIYIFVLTDSDLKEPYIVEEFIILMALRKLRLLQIATGQHIRWTHVFFRKTRPRVQEWKMPTD